MYNILIKYVVFNKNPIKRRGCFIIKIDTTEDKGSTGNKAFRVRTSPIKYDYNYELKIRESIEGDDIDKISDLEDDYVIEFDEAGDYYILISGKFPHMTYYNYNNSGWDRDARKIISIEQWGDNKWENMSYMFSYCKNLEKDNSRFQPDLSNVHDMTGMFKRAENFDTNISNWSAPNINSKPDEFDEGSDIVGEIDKQPDW